MSWTFEAELFRWDAQEAATWVFLAVPEEISEEIRLLSGPRHGFGSVRVGVTIGTSNWRTSVFPEKNSRYVLPVKKEIRRKQKIDIGDITEVTLTLLV